jgi:hypothetical protein
VDKIKELSAVVVVSLWNTQGTFHKHSKEKTKNPVHDRGGISNLIAAREMCGRPDVPDYKYDLAYFASL